MMDKTVDSAAVCDINRAVRDLMNTEPPTVSPQASLLAAAEIMFKGELRHLILADGDRKVMGVVSQRDLLMQLLRVLAQAGPAGDSPPSDSRSVAAVSELIKSAPITVPPDLPMYKAAAILASQKIGCLPVVDEKGTLLGMLGTNEVLIAVTRKIGLQEFEFFTPSDGPRRKPPAYFRRTSRSLILPLDSLGEVELSMEYAQLGYDPDSGRIVVRLVDQPGNGARKISRDKDCLTISASDFVTHYEIKSDGSAYDVVNHSGYFVLIPKQPGSDSFALGASRRG